MAAVVIIPDFREITYHSESSRMASSSGLNASTDLSCDSLGSKLKPDLELRPKGVDDGDAQVVIPDYTIVAVKMYISTPSITESKIRMAPCSP